MKVSTVKLQHQEKTKNNKHTLVNSKDTLQIITKKIIKNYQKNTILSNTPTKEIPLKRTTINLLKDIFSLLYPGYFGTRSKSPLKLQEYIEDSVKNIFQNLTKQIYHCIQYTCKKTDDVCPHCFEISTEQSLTFLHKIPSIKDALLEDLLAAYNGDPAAKSHDEVIISYPGYFAIAVYRIAHELHKQNIPLLPRIMTEYAHSETGTDIHPGAEIGRSFFIDHATGVVIGETTKIGNNVRIYQGVTLGALSFKRKEDGTLVKGGKRHPTIGDDVVIYSGATILGGKTTIGDRSIIGGNVWLTHSIPSDTIIMHTEPRLKTKNRHNSLDYQI